MEVVERARAEEDGVRQCAEPRHEMRRLSVRIRYVNGEERRLAGCDARMLGRHEPIAVDERVRLVTAERLALGLAGDGDGLEELEVGQNPLARIGVDDDAIAARGGEDDA